MIWVGSWRCVSLVTWFCYQLIAKPGNKTAAPPWNDPYITAAKKSKTWGNRHSSFGIGYSMFSNLVWDITFTSFNACVFRAPGNVMWNVKLFIVVIYIMCMFWVFIILETYELRVIRGSYVQLNLLTNAHVSVGICNSMFADVSFCLIVS